MAYAANSFDMINQLDQWGVKFEKDETGDYAVRKVHHLGSYVLPMPEGHHMKKILYRQLKKARVEVTNRVVVTRVLTGADGEVVGGHGLRLPHRRHLCHPDEGAVLCTGAAGRIGCRHRAI
jgi:succinate dehydrogenase/fumarate reductase flavoprotein subunit